MTHTLRKRMLRTSSPPHTHWLDRRMSRSDSVIDPAELAEALRVLAIRAHHALKIAQDRVDESIRVELHDLRSAIRLARGRVPNPATGSLAPVRDFATSSDRIRVRLIQGVTTLHEQVNQPRRARRKCAEPAFRISRASKTQTTLEESG